jgi:dUTP pyrophosphatase
MFNPGSYIPFESIPGLKNMVNRRVDRRVREILGDVEDLVARKVREELNRRDFPDFKVFVLPGGTMPERKTDGAEGFDCGLRAVVSSFDMDHGNKLLRKTIFDFTNIPKDDLKVQSRIALMPTENGNELTYKLEPGESILVGVGFVIEMPFPVFHWVTPRSGLAAKWNITINNAPGTVDSDYRGEAGVLVKNNNDAPYFLKKDMRIAQIIFQRAIIPNLISVGSYAELSDTSRGIGGFGSTGLR